MLFVKVGRGERLLGLLHRFGRYWLKGPGCPDIPHLPQNGQLAVPCNVQSCASLLYDLPIVNRFKIYVRVGELNV